MVFVLIEKKKSFFTIRILLSQIILYLVPWSSGGTGGEVTYPRKIAFILTASHHISFTSSPKRLNLFQGDEKFPNQEANLEIWAPAIMRFRGTVNSEAKCKSNTEWPQSVHYRFKENIPRRAYQPGWYGTPKSVNYSSFKSSPTGFSLERVWC